MERAELALAGVRGVFLAASLVAFGVAVFWTLVAPPLLRTAGAATRLGFEARARRLFRVAMVVAAAAALVWLVAQAAYMAEADSLPDAAAAIWPVLTATHFGRVLGIRLVLLALAGAALGDGTNGERRALAAGAIGLAAGLQGWTAHAAAAEGTDRAILLGAESLHLLAAGAWLGSLPSLFMLVAALPPDQGARALRRFSPLGMFCVAILTATALAQGSLLIGGLPGLVGTDYGRVALLKLALFLAMLLLAASHRFHHARALGGPRVTGARWRLQASIAAEASLGLAVVFAAALLADLHPAVHQQPVWPFAWRLSLENLYDPDYGADLRGGLLAVAGALLVVIVGLIWRTILPIVLVAASVVVIWATPHLDLLLVEAYPTSFYQSPTGFTSATIARGAELFSTYCTGCHGSNGGGDGPAAKSLPVPPADLTAQHLWAHSDGELFWWLSHGVEASRGALAMPGFADRLSEDDRWALIDYVHANNAGMTMAAAGQWPHAMLAPDFYATCANGRMVTIANLRGRVVRIIASDRSDVMPASSPLAAQLTAIQLSRDPQMRPTAAACVAADPSTWAAYATVSGVDQSGLAGTQFLVDPQGWLRARWRPGDPAGWTDAQGLQAEIEQILAHPIATSAGRGHVHHH
jgi:putative copper export protein/mono/diheme cytochrome c family protein